MKTFNDLLAVLDKLLSPEGCPWDREQTMMSLRGSLLEETCELIEAIDLGDVEHIEEELGDLLFNALFLCRLAEKEGQSSLQSALTNVTEKLIRRHPHIFESATSCTTEQVLEQWDVIKSKEQGKDKRLSVLDGIPKGLPALARAQKAMKKLQKSGYNPATYLPQVEVGDGELALGVQLLQLIADPVHKGVDAEQALKRVLALQEQTFRQHEESFNA